MPRPYRIDAPVIGKHHLDSLPADIVSYIRAGLLAYTRENVFSSDGLATDMPSRE